MVLRIIRENDSLRMSHQLAMEPPGYLDPHTRADTTATVWRCSSQSGSAVSTCTRARRECPASRRLPHGTQSTTRTDASQEIDAPLPIKAYTDSMLGGKQCGSTAASGEHCQAPATHARDIVCC